MHTSEYFTCKSILHVKECEIVCFVSDTLLSRESVVCWILTVDVMDFFGALELARDGSQ